MKISRIFHFCLPAVIFLLPFEIDLRRWGIDLPWINTTLEIALAVTMVFWILKKAEERKPVRGTSLGMPVLVFLGVHVLSALFAAGDPYWGIKYTLRLSGGVLLFFMITDTVRSREYAVKLITVLLASCAVSCAVALGEKYFLPHMLGFLKIFSRERSYLHGVQGLLRVSSTFIYTNVYAMYLEMVIPAAGGMFIYSYMKAGGFRGIPVCLNYFLVLLFSQVLFFTYTRSSPIVAAAVFCFMFCLLYAAGRTAGDSARGANAYRAAGILLVSVIVLYMLTMKLDFTLQRRMGTITDMKYNPNATRLYIWKCALEVIRRNPLSGIGPDNFRWLYAARYARESPFFVMNPVTPVPGVDTNSLYLEVLVNLGMGGFAVFSWIVLKSIISSILYLLKNMLLYVKNNNILLVYAGVLGSLFAYLLHGMVDSFGSYQAIVFLFWIILGLVAVIPEFDRD